MSSATQDLSSSIMTSLNFIGNQHGRYLINTEKLFLDFINQEQEMLTIIWKYFTEKWKGN